MYWLVLFATLVAAYFVRREYDNDRIGWAIFWSILLGWDLHTLLYYI